MTARYGGQAPMNRGATIVFAPTWLVPGRIPDQPGAGSHRFATDCITGGFSREGADPTVIIRQQAAKRRRSMPLSICP